jgi:hypothetical protein
VLTYREFRPFLWFKLLVPGIWTRGSSLSARIVLYPFWHFQRDIVVIPVFRGIARLLDWSEGLGRGEIIG